MDEQITKSFVYSINPNEFFDYSSINQSSMMTEDVMSKPSIEAQYSTQELKSSDYLVAFSTNTKNYCVGIVDMVNSTKISARVGPTKISKYYQIFLNSMSKILSRFGGFVIKNVGDCLVYYFPESSKDNAKFGLMSCLECSLAMVEARDMISEFLEKEKLPPLDYRVSADYGAVITMKSTESNSIDMIGPPVNMCSKINRLAKPNGIVIGGDLFERVKDFKDYKFSETRGYSLGFKLSYPVYSVTRKE